MWDSIFSVALTNGIFACLFVALFVYQLKDSRQREKKYQDTIASLSCSLKDFDAMQQDIEDIKKVVVYKKS